MALAVSLLFVLFVSSASYFTFSYFERRFKESISAQQFSLVSSLADNIDDKLSIALNALKAVAAIAPDDAFTNVDRAQRFLNDNTGIQSIFDNNTAFISLEGKLFAEGRYVAGRRGKDLSYREWYKKTIERRIPYISEPFVSTHPPIHPVVMMTVPIFDRRGDMKGMLVGSIDLLGGNFLANLSKVKIGKTGFVFIADMNRTLIVHPDKNRIMKPAAPPGVNTLVDRAFNGFEGSGETVTSFGVPMLVSIKHLATASWFLGANYPQSEAYASIYKARHYFAMAIVVATAMLLFITWLIMKRLMSPLAAVTRHLEHLPDMSPQERLLTIHSADEIGVLATTFNTMLKTLDNQQDALKEQKRKIEDEHAFLQTMMDAIPDLIFCKDRDSIYRRCNESFATLFVGRTKEKVIGFSDFDIAITEEEAAFFQQTDREAMLAGEPCRYEVWVKLADGRQVLLETIKVPYRDAVGNIEGVIGISRDITGHKRTEYKLHEQTMMLEKEVAERQAAQEALAFKHQQLERMNNSLSELVSDTVGNLRQKDQLLIQQSRHAAMGEMINNIAHQWRQPLNNIGLIVQNMMYSFERGELTLDEMQSECGITMDTIQYMSRTIDDFRHFFRRDKNKQKFAIIDTLSRTLVIVSPSLKNSSITVDLDVNDSVTAFGYPNELSQVLLIILNNARDVLVERQVVAPHIRIRVFDENDSVVVTISDNGGGIAADTLSRIFDPYFSTKEPGKGTGIGLYMSKAIIEQNMEGRLAVRNIEGGAEFRIEITSVVPEEIV
jgi:PAS domain S-box-containing protein